MALTFPKIKNGLKKLHLRLQPHVETYRLHRETEVAAQRSEFVFPLTGLPLTEDVQAGSDVHVLHVSGWSQGSQGLAIHEHHVVVQTWLSLVSDGVLGLLAKETNKPITT